MSLKRACQWFNMCWQLYRLYCCNIRVNRNTYTCPIPNSIRNLGNLISPCLLVAVYTPNIKPRTFFQNSDNHYTIRHWIRKKLFMLLTNSHFTEECVVESHVENSANRILNYKNLLWNHCLGNICMRISKSNFRIPFVLGITAGISNKEGKNCSEIRTTPWTSTFPFFFYYKLKSTWGTLQTVLDQSKPILTDCWPKNVSEWWRNRVTG